MARRRARQRSEKLVERSWQGRIPEEFLLTDLTRSSTARLKANRYYLAQVRASVEVQRGKKIVRFEVARGRRGDEARLSFTGNVALDDGTLKQALPKTDTPEFFLLLEQLKELARGIRLRYAAEGYLDATIGVPVTVYGRGVQDLPDRDPHSGRSLDPSLECGLRR